MLGNKLEPVKKHTSPQRQNYCLHVAASGSISDYDNPESWQIWLATAFSGNIGLESQQRFVNSTCRRHVTRLRKNESEASSRLVGQAPHWAIESIDKEVLSRILLEGLWACRYEREFTKFTGLNKQLIEIPQHYICERHNENRPSAVLSALLNLLHVGSTAILTQVSVQLAVSHFKSYMVIYITLERI